ncbi:MAG: PKD domain-containing protein [Thermoplasmatota archaeon]
MRYQEIISFSLAVFMISISLIAFSGIGNSGSDVRTMGTTLKNGGVSPEAGWPGNTTFGFYVNYSDSGNLPPSSVDVVIDNIHHSMNTPSGNYASGINCTLSLKTINPGNHSYYFIAQNTSYPNWTYARYPANGSLSLSVLGSNYYPNLNYTGHDPSNPLENQTVMFWAVYTDLGGDAPLFVNVVINGTQYNMSGDGTNYKGGVWYHYNHTFTSGFSHTYCFETMDDNPDRRLYYRTGNRTLAMRAEPELYNGTVTPESGDARKTNFTFSVVYRNRNGDSPYYIHLVIEGRSYSMDRVDYNSSFEDGVEYERTLSQFFSGMHEYYFYAYSRYGDPVRLPSGNGTYTFNATGNYSQPELYNASITPESGNSSTIFNISVYYKDADNDPPKYVCIYAYTGYQETNISMTVSGTDYRNGTYCYVNTTLPTGRYQLYFASRDITNLYDSTHVWLNVSVMDGDSYGKLSNGYAEPNPAVQNTSVNFSVNCFDPMGWPDYVYLILDGDDYYMWSDWVNESTFVFRRDVYLNLPGGEHDFHFEGRDSYGYNIRYPEEGNLTLYVYDHLPVLKDPGIDPKIGNDQDTFDFWITYLDEKGLAPSSIKLFLGNGSYTMTSTENSYKNGVNYSHSMGLSVGRHYYYFMTTLSNGAFARYPAKGELHIDVDGHTGLVSRQLIPTTGDTDTLFNFTIKYVDTNGLVPSYVRVFIDNDFFNMTVDGTDYENGTTCHYTTKLGLGNHTYYFEALNAKRSYRSPTPGNYFKVHVSAVDDDHSPILSSGRVSPIEGNSSTIFTFSIVYLDSDGDEPNKVSILINEVEHSMTVSGTDYKNGVNCTYSTKLQTGNYSFYFIAYDSTNMTARYPALTSMKLSVGDGGSSSNPPEKKAPIAHIAYSVSGKNASLDGSKSYDPDGFIVTYTWYIGDDIYSGKYRNISFDEPGYYSAKLVVVDNDGYSDYDIAGFWAYDRTSSRDPHEVGGVITVDKEGSETQIEKNGTSISVKDSDDDSVTFSVKTSEDDSIVVMEVDKDMLEVGEDEVLQLRIGGKIVGSASDLESLLTSSSSTPLYYIVDTGDSYRIVLYLPDETDSDVDLLVVEDPEKEKDDSALIWLILLIAVVVIILVLIVMVGFSRREETGEDEDLLEDLEAIEESLNSEE